MTKVAKRWQKLTRVVKNSEEVPKDGKVAKKWQKIPKVTKKMTKMPQNLPKVVKGLKKLPKHLTFDDICHFMTFDVS